MLDLISIGTVTIDLYYKGASLTENKESFNLAIGGKYFVDHFYEGLGGGGANVAIGVKRLGRKSGLMAKIGDNPFKSLIFSKLDETGIEYKDFCSVEKDYNNISSILLSKSGEKTIINYRTPHQHIISTEKDYDVLLKAQAVYMANLAGVSFKDRIDMLRHAKKYVRTTFANLNVTDCRRHIEEILHFLDPVDIFIINTHEFADLVKTSYEAIDFHTNVVSKFSPFHHEKMLVLTDGRKGSFTYYEGRVYHEPAVKHVEVVDATGAGDGYTAGFISEYLQTKDIKKSMKAGADYATVILQKLGSN
ncbi:hypothetical protein BH09PAT2_BH09PAT2_07220 [soil metagenome]